MRIGQPGQIVLIGSGETAPNMQSVYHALFQQFKPPVRVAILETPAGFEPNSHHVAAQIGTYLEHHLQNFAPQVTIVPARKRGTAFSPDDPALLEPLYEADVIFIGPGSPSYAVRQLRDSVTWHTLRALHRQGTALIFASAGVLALSTQTLPIYEIYKVGEDLHWKSGLDFFVDFGLSLIFVPHWNNNDGGDVVDTNRCYMGQERFAQLLGLLPGGADSHTIVGIDEKTALIFDLAQATCHVLGTGSVTIGRSGQNQQVANRAKFSIHTLGDFRLPDGHAGISEDIWQRSTTNASRAGGQETQASLPAEVQRLLDARQAARAGKDWRASDDLRNQLATLGWRVLDTSSGQVVERSEVG